MNFKLHATTFQYFKVLSRLVLTLAGFIILTACNNRMEDVQSVISNDPTPLEETENVEILYSDSAKIRLKVKGDKLLRFGGEEPYIEFPEGIDMRFYDEKDFKEKSSLTANYAIRYEKDSKMEAKGDVVLINRDGDRLSTEHLIWNEQEEKIYSNKLVRIETDDEVIIGENGFEADPEFTYYKIYQTQGDFSVRDE